MKKLNFSICIPVYKGSDFLKRTLTSIYRQPFKNFEIIIGDDNPHHLKKEIAKTKKIIKFFNSKKIKYFKNRKNLGYPKNLRKIISKAKGDVIFLMGQDDVLSGDALQKTHDAFFLAKKIGLVIRPYFWFDKDIKKPIRAVRPYDKNKNSVLSIFDGQKAIESILNSVGQLSGLAYLKKIASEPVGDETFSCHIYPLITILKNYRCVFLKDYTVAVGTLSSQTRRQSSIYDISPTASWLKMINYVFDGKKYQPVKKTCVKKITSNYEGLIQFKNFAKRGVLEREILILIKENWLNILQPKFWFYVFLSLFIPKKALIFLTDNYKRFVLSKFISSTPLDDFYTTKSEIVHSLLFLFLASSSKLAPPYRF